MRAALALAVLAGCGGEGFCPADHVTIEQGLFGVVSYTSDVGDRGPEPSGAVRVEVMDPLGGLAGTATSDDHGFFEIALSVGDYQLCAAPERCTDFTVEEQAHVRVDYVLEFGPSSFVVRDPDACVDWK